MFLFENDRPWFTAPSPSAAAPPAIVNLSRRSFIKHTSLTAGAVFALGVFSGCGEEQEPLMLAKAPPSGTMDDAAFQPNVFIGLNEEGDVFIVCSRSEMGQGIRTGMPPVIADEMEADWDRVHVVQADGDPVYGNQNTDGSRSVRNHFDEWRLAGATARAMLAEAAAQTWGVSPSECVASNHVVRHEASGRELTYGQLAATAANIAVPENPVLKDRSAWRYIGKPLHGVDNHDMATGKAVFGLDVTVPDMVYASVERCPVIGGRIASYDDTDALAVPGVMQVVELAPTSLPPAFNALGGLAVVARDTWSAIKGRRALKVEWEYGPNESYNSDVYRRQLEASATSPGRLIRNQGDVEPALAGAETTLDATYYVPMLAHAPMEPPNAVAWVKPDGTCEAWAPTQAPQGARGAVAGALGIQPEQVTMHVTLLGGGFGRKSKPDFIVEAALISQSVGAPVKVTWTREDEIQFGYFHAPSVQHLRAGLDESGKPVAWVHRTTFPSISSTFAPDVVHASDGELGLGFTSVPYDIPNMLCENGPAEAHVRIGWLRSVCNIHHAFAVNAFAGEMAAAAGRDQKDYLLELIGSPRNLSHLIGDETGPYGELLERQPYETGRLRHVVELVAEKAGWDAPRPEGRALGIAAHYSFVSYVAHAAEVSVEGDVLRVHAIHCAIDCGTYVNPDRVKAQMEGGAVFGLTLALYGNITARDGAIEQSNFHDYPMVRLAETPEIYVHLVDNDRPAGGVGEPGVPSVAPAVTNAILNLTGNPVRDLPIKLA